MYNNQSKKIFRLFILIFIVIQFASIAFAGQLSLRVIPESINAGDTVRIEFIDQYQPIKNYEIQIISPTGEVHNLVPLNNWRTKGKYYSAKLVIKDF